MMKIVHSKHPDVPDTGFFSLYINNGRQRRDVAFVDRRADIILYEYTVNNIRLNRDDSIRPMATTWYQLFLVYLLLGFLYWTREKKAAPGCLLRHSAAAMEGTAATEETAAHTSCGPTPFCCGAGSPDEEGRLAELSIIEVKNGEKNLNKTSVCK